MALSRRKVIMVVQGRAQYSLCAFVFELDWKRFIHFLYLLTLSSDKSELDTLKQLLAGEMTTGVGKLSVGVGADMGICCVIMILMQARRIKNW